MDGPIDGNKCRRVLETIRGQIVSGAYSDNRRLPTRTEIGKQFGVGMATVQKALETLARDGFLTAKPGAGTYLVEYAPHECCFGLVLPNPSATASPIHDEAVRQAARMLDNGTSIQFRIYGISSVVQYRQDTDRLIQDAASHRLAGLISPFYCGELSDTPVMTTPGIPRVFSSYVNHPEACRVGPDGGYLEMALEYLRSRGRRRIAHLQIECETGASMHDFEQELRRRGLEVRPYWNQRITAGLTASPAANLVRLLMELEGDKRPDALLVHDDNLLNSVVAGLLASGIRGGDDLEVVSLANFPSPRPQGVQVQRIGYDWVELLRQSIHTIRQARQGHKPPPVLLPAVFEEDLPFHRPMGRSPAIAGLYYGKRAAEPQQFL